MTIRLSFERLVDLYLKTNRSVALDFYCAIEISSS